MKQSQRAIALTRAAQSGHLTIGFYGSAATRRSRGAPGRVRDRRPPPTRRPVRPLHRDRFVDVNRAADLEDRAALRELYRRIEAVGRHDRVPGQATRSAVADRAARADRLGGPGRCAAIENGRTELSEPLKPTWHTARCARPRRRPRRGHRCTRTRNSPSPHPFSRGRRGCRPVDLMTNGPRPDGHGDRKTAEVSPG
jgi:hypothetical protein